jgi:hypothetical protein
MRSQTSLETTVSTRHITDEQPIIPRHEQDDDRWRYAMPGRDPVMKGSQALQNYQQQLMDLEMQNKDRLLFARQNAALGTSGRQL